MLLSIINNLKNNEVSSPFIYLHTEFINKIWSREKSDFILIFMDRAS
jgi:hypothetical protein